MDTRSFFGEMDRMKRLTKLRLAQVGGYRKMRETYGIDVGLLWRVEHGRQALTPKSRVGRKLELIFGLPLRELLEEVGPDE